MTGNSNRSRFKALLAGAVAFALFAPGAQVQAETPEGDTVMSAVSGRKSERTADFVFERGDTFMTAIRAKTAGSRACYLDIMGRTLAGEAAEPVVIDVCTTGRIFDAIETEAVPAGSAVTGLSVCLSQRKSKVTARFAGVKLFYTSEAAIAAGSTEAEGEVGASRSACSDWRETVTCPAGSAAIGVTGHFFRSNVSDFDLIGLGLVCRKLSV